MTHRASVLSRNVRLSAILSSLAALFLPVIQGCGTGEYERRLDEGLAAAKANSKFNGLYGPQALPETSVSVRIPKMFKDPPLVEGAQVNGKPVDARRIKPGLFPFPFLKFTYEAYVDDAAGAKLPCYCYVGAVSKAGGRVRNPGGEIEVSLKNKAEFEKLTNWTDFQGETPEGRGNTWKKIRMESQQDFRTLDKAGQEKYAQMPGLLEIYVQEEAENYVFIVWRMPKSIEQNVELSKWAPIVAGCVSIKK